MTDQSLSAPVAKRADQLAVGDRIQPGYLPAYARSGEGLVMLVEPYAYRGADWVFVAFACADGDRNCAHYLPDGEVTVIPADRGLDYSREADDPTPASGARVDPHVGAVTEDGLVDETVTPGECPNCNHRPWNDSHGPKGCQRIGSVSETPCGCHYAEAG